MLPALANPKAVFVCLWHLSKLPRKVSPWDRAAYLGGVERKETTAPPPHPHPQLLGSDDFIGAGNEQARGGRLFLEDFGYPIIFK